MCPSSTWRWRVSGTDLHASVTSLQWIVDSYALAFAALMLSAGSLGDRFGTRRLFVGGLALFGLASLACAFSADATQLIVARAVQGIGAAAMLPNSLGAAERRLRPRFACAGAHGRTVGRRARNPSRRGRSSAAC